MKPEDDLSKNGFSLAMLMRLGIVTETDLAQARDRPARPFIRIS